MSLAADIAAMKRELSALKTATCEVRLASAAFAANPSNRVACHYEAVSPQSGNKLDYEGGNGYGYTVWFDEAVTIAENDTVVIVASPVARDIGKRIQVQQIPPRGNTSAVDRIDGVLRNG